MTSPPQLFLTAPQACGYYPAREAQNLLIDPAYAAPEAIYDAALEHGFRRSGRQLYRPHCPQCAACVPTRLAVQQFRADRSQRRNLRDNADLSVRLQHLSTPPEYFQLYARYLAWRHPDAGMDATSPEDFAQFLGANWRHARCIEIRQGQQLVAVALTDQATDSLSAVYTFYEPAAATRGLGTFAVLQQIRLAQQLGLNWLYLGFWLAGHPKMDYKRRFQPQQHRLAAGWTEVATRPGPNHRA